MTGPQISTARQRETAALKIEWEKKRRHQDDDLRSQYGEGFKGFDDVGRPIIEGIDVVRPMRGPEMVRALERAFIATGDPIFDDALRALRSYGLDQGEHRRAAMEIWGDPDKGFLFQVKYFVEQRNLSSRAASERVVSELGIFGHSFESAADRIRHKFDAWKSAGYPSEDVDFEAGDLGYRIGVASAEGFNLEVFTRSLPTRTENQPATRWWRRLFRDGAVSIRYLGER